MTYQLRFLSEVEGDVRIGMAWYEERSFGLGDDFLREFYAGVDDIVESPLLYRTVQGPVRRRILNRFPYRSTSSSKGLLWWSLASSTVPVTRGESKRSCAIDVHSRR